jgi:hypothetical protein
MTNDKPPVAPVEGHYAMLRNGQVVGPINLSLFDKDFYLEIKGEIFNWNNDGTANWMGSEYDIIATISPASMQMAVNPKILVGLVKDAFDGCPEFQEARAGVNAMADRLARLEAILPLAGAVLDHADAHCRAFPIATVPKTLVYELWDAEEEEWVEASYYRSSITERYTHWRPLPPPPSNPPLPEVFVELGAALEKIKEGR